MRLLLRLLPPGFALALCAACSTTPALELNVTPATIPGDGVTPITVQVKLTRGGGPADGVVHITTSAGHFKDPQGGDPSVIEASPSDGVATVYIIPPRKGRGTIDIVATSSLDNTALKKTSSVALTPAGGLASFISFTCAKQNLGAFVSGLAAPLHVQCTAVAYDASSRPIPNASIETMAEAGHLDWAVADDGSQNLIYTVNPGDPPPKDVEPFDSSGKPVTCPAACIADPNASGCAEPCWVEGAITHNPRDGLATLVVAVPGVKDFNSRGEPYVDSNDNGVRDPDEAFIDYNGNGKYDGPDGSKSDIMIWRSVRIVWSGDADVSATAHGSKMSAVVSGTSAQVTLRLNDRNYNTLAADGVAGTDAITISSGSCAQSHTLTLPVPTLQMRQDTPGIKLKADTGEIDGPGFSSAYRNGSDYSFTATIDAKPDQCSLEAAISRSFDPGAPGFSAGGELSSEQVSYLLSFP